jgi:hypothetical protein
MCSLSVTVDHDGTVPWAGVGLVWESRQSCHPPALAVAASMQKLSAFQHIPMFCKAAFPSFLASSLLNRPKMAPIARAKLQTITWYLGINHSRPIGIFPLPSDLSPEESTFVLLLFPLFSDPATISSLPSTTPNCYSPLLIPASRQHACFASMSRTIIPILWHPIRHFTVSS